MLTMVNIRKKPNAVRAVWFSVMGKLQWGRSDDLGEPKY
jgi:hypothetical protein